MSGANIVFEYSGFRQLVADLGAAPEVFKKATDSAVKSALYHLRLKLKEAVRTNEFGWPKQKAFPTDRQLAQLVSKYETGKGSSLLNAFLRAQALIFANQDKPFFGRLGKLMFYEYHPDTISGDVGAVNAKGQNKIGLKGQTVWRKLQMGYEKPIDSKTRSFFAMAGIPIRRTTTVFHIPARPLFGKVADARSAEVMGMLNKTIAEKIQANLFHTDTMDKAFT